MSVLLSLDTAELRCGSRMNCGSKQSEFLSMSEWLFGRIFKASRYFGRGEEFASSNRNCASAQLLKKSTLDVFLFAASVQSVMQIIFVKISESGRKCMFSAV